MKTRTLIYPESQQRRAAFEVRRHQVTLRIAQIQSYSNADELADNDHATQTADD
jgi:hypothetical protein